jgi:hypothetical protein
MPQRSLGPDEAGDPDGPPKVGRRFSSNGKCAANPRWEQGLSCHTFSLQRPKRPSVVQESRQANASQLPSEGPGGPGLSCSGLLAAPLREPRSGWNPRPPPDTTLHSVGGAASGSSEIELIN